jgi:hypothetical protein
MPRMRLALLSDRPNTSILNCDPHVGVSHNRRCQIRMEPPQGVATGEAPISGLGRLIVP